MDTNFRDLVIKHYQKPQSFGFINDPNAVKQRHNSEFCVDDLTIEVLWKKNKVISAKFEGVACTIATSVMDLFCLEIHGKSKKQILDIVNRFKEMLKLKKTEIKNDLNELGYFGLVANQPNRVRCALIPAELVKKTI